MLIPEITDASDEWIAYAVGEQMTELRDQQDAPLAAARALNTNF
jgi:hypothetical protein